MLPTYDNHGYSHYVDNYVDMLPNDEEVNTSFSTQEPPMFKILYEKFPARVNKTQVSVSFFIWSLEIIWKLEISEPNLLKEFLDLLSYENNLGKSVEQSYNVVTKKFLSKKLDSINHAMHLHFSNKHFDFWWGCLIES